MHLSGNRDPGIGVCGITENRYPEKAPVFLSLLGRLLIIWLTDWQISDVNADTIYVDQSLTQLITKVEFQKILQRIKSPHRTLAFRL